MASAAEDEEEGKAPRDFNMSKSLQPLRVIGGPESKCAASNKKLVEVWSAVHSVNFEWVSSHCRALQQNVNDLVQRHVVPYKPQQT